ncbi:MAG: hypothetical protein AB7L76_14575 [Burkholderiaceae bacterium]
MKKLALIWCSRSASQPLQASLLNVFRSEGQQWETIEPGEDDFVRRRAHYDGYVISGSPRSVIDDADKPFVRNLLDLIRAVDERSSAPMIGVCFGAQALAAALGGSVSRNPDGCFKLGSETLRWLPQPEPSRWPELAGDVVLGQSHGECISRLPPGSELLAESPTAACEIFLVRRRFLGIQGHPELDNALLRQTFLPAHRARFDEQAWQQVERDAAQPLTPQPVAAIGRRLLRDGRL